MTNPDLKQLAKKFPEQDIEWRVQQCGMGKRGPWALIIPYITNRAIMARLDKAVGPGKWKNEFVASPCGKGYLCGISIKFDGEWITRWDGAEVSGGGNIDEVKTTLSNSMKRTGVQWGIGRYLYQFDAEFADTQVCDSRYDVLPGYTYQEGKIKGGGKFGFQWKPKPLQSWALPVNEFDIAKYVSAMKQATSSDELKTIFTGAYKLAIAEDDDDLLAKFTKAKDDAKQRIIESAEAVNNKLNHKLNIMVEEQTGIINTATNESAVNGLTEIAIGKAKSIFVGEQLSAIIKLLKTAQRTKLQSLGE